MEGLSASAADARDLMIALLEQVLTTREVPAAVLLQAGHSIETALSSYGFSNLDHQHINRFSMKAYFEASCGWQRAIGILESSDGLEGRPFHPYSHVFALTFFF
jgi:hypothetical protein